MEQCARSVKVAQPVMTALLVLLVGCANSPSQVPPAAPNLLVNTDFQKTTNNMPDSWYFDGSLAKKGSVKIVPGSRPGSLALCLNPNGQNKDSNAPLALAQIIFPEPFLGHKLTVRASLKGASGASATVHLFALARSKPVEHVTLSQSGDAIATKQDSLQVPANTDQLFLFVATSSTSGSACFEDLGVFETDPEAPTAPRRYERAATPGSASAPLPAVTVASAPASPVVSRPAPPPAVSNINLIRNADFRHKTRDLPDEWALDKSLARKGSVSIEQGGLNPGDLSLRLTPNSSNSDPAKPFGLGQNLPADSYRGKRLALKVSFKVTPGGTAFVHLFALAGDKPLQQVTLTQMTSTNGFLAQEGYLDVPNNADHFLFAITTNSAHGSASFADLHVGPVANAETAAPRASSGASIRVNARKVLRKIPAGIYGSNIEWVRNGNGIWDSSTNQLRPAIVQHMHDAGISVIRYPGGGLADHFHWRDSIGPIRSRPVRPHVLDPESSQLTFGTDELIKISRLVGAEPLITVNITDGTSQEAAAWVAYCNDPNNAERAKNGAPAPYKVKYWEIGNEQYIDSRSPGIPNSYLTPDQYAKRFQEFAAAMKAVDPTIVIGGIGGMKFGAYQLLKDDDWNARLLRAAGKSVDFLSVHNGYAPVVGESPNLQFFDVYKAMLAFPSQVEANLAQMSSQLDSYGDATRKTKIAITEWGPLFAADTKSAWAGHPKTLGSALYVASLLNVFLRSPRVDMATWLKVTEDNYMGWLYPNGDPKPSFQTLQLYRQHLGTQLTETLSSSPGFSSPAMGSVAASSNTPYIDAVSGVNDAGSRLTLIVVNRDFVTAWSTSIQIDGFQPGSNGKAWELTADSLDANNGEDLEPRLNWAKQAEAPATPMYSRGKPGTVVARERAVNGLSSSFYYSFPARSVTVLELTGTK